MAHPSLDEVIGWAVALLGGGGVVKLIELRTRQREKRDEANAAEPAALIRAVGELQGALTDGSKELVGAFINEFKFLRGQVVELRADVDGCESKHAACEDKVTDLNRRLDENAHDRAELKAQLDRLMADPPAAH